MRLVLYTILLAGGVTSVARLKRQALPSNHVQVHSLNSNVSVSDAVVVVTSSDSRIDLLEKKLNLSTWGTSSNVSFDTFDTFVNYTATAAETFAKMQGVELHAQAAKSEFSMTTSKSFDSSINNSLTGRVNVSIADSGMKIQALEGKWADVSASTREDSKANKSMNIYSNMSMDSNYERRLILSAVDRLYDMEAVLLGARVRTSYGDVTIDIDPDYRTARIYTNAHTIELKTTLSPFGIEFNNERMLISAPFEETTATILKNTSDVHFIVGQLSQLRLNRGGGDIQLGGNPTQADKINVTSSKMSMDLFATREMDARTNQSHISMMTNSTTASLTSLFHHLHVSGGVPQMGLYTGNLTIAISTKPATPPQPTLFPGFSAPPDKFASVGPPKFPGDAGNIGPLSRGTQPPDIAGSTGGDEVTVVTQSSFTGEETERTVGYRTPSPETVETTLAEVIGVNTVNPVEGGNTGGETTTEVPVVVSSDVTLLPTQGEVTTEQSVNLSTEGAESQTTAGQVTVGGETAGETHNGEVTTASVIGEGTVSVPGEVELSTAGPVGGETSSAAPSEQTTASPGAETTIGAPDGSGATVGGAEATTVDAAAATTKAGEAEGSPSTAAGEGAASTGAGEGSPSTSAGEGAATTASVEGETAVTSASPAEGQTTGGGDSTDTTVLLTTVLTIDTSSIGGETIPSDYPRPATLPGEFTDGGVSTVSPDSGASGDTTTSGVVIDQSTLGGEGLTTESLVTPPPLIPTDFVTPGQFIPTDFVTPGSLPPEDVTTATDDFAFAHYSTDSVPDQGFNIFATISGVQLPVAPTPLTAVQQIEPDFPGPDPGLPEALTRLEKRSVPSIVLAVVIVLLQVNASDSSFTRELTRNVIEIANRTLESTTAIADRRKRNIEVDPIMLNVTDVNQVDDNEAEVRFAVGLHAFDNIDSLIDALKKSIPNGSENGIVIIERIEVYATVDNGGTSWILPVILFVAAILIVGLGVLAYKILNASALFKGLPACCDRSPRVADSASFRSFS